MSNDLVVNHTQTNADLYRASTDAAGLCKEIVLRTAQLIQGRKYVRVEGWQAIAIAHGCVASAESVERIDLDGCKGFSAVGAIRRMTDGVEIARAEGFVGDDEATWGKRPVYARRAMAQTRAISRACRSAFAHVVVLIDSNLSTTPAEEMEFAEPVNVAPKPPGVITGTQLQEAQTRNGRKSSSQAKKDGDDVKIKTEIGGLDHAGLADFTLNFDSYTATMPAGWLTPIRDMIEERLAELNGEAAVAEEASELDAAFRGTMGSSGAPTVPGRHAPHSPAR